MRERREEEGRKLGVDDMWSEINDDLPVLGGDTEGVGLPHEVVSRIRHDRAAFLFLVAFFRMPW